MKIVQILPELNEGGVEYDVLELNRELSKRGYESLVISNGGKLVSQIVSDGGEHIQIDVCSKNPLTAVFRALKLKKVLRSLNPDVVHVRSRVPAWLVYFANRSLQLKVVSTVHGFNSVNIYSSIMTKADKVICVSGSVKAYIQKHYKIENEKIEVFPGGIDTKRFDPTKIDETFVKEFKNQYGLHGKLIITSVGRVTQLKDYETFIRAIHILKKEFIDIVGLIVGGVREDKNEYYKSLLKLIDELDLANNIIFTGSQTRMPEIYHSSHVVVSSSKKPESFGRSVGEAIAVNTPVVASNHGGVKDIIIECQQGYFFEVGDDRGLADKIILAKELKVNGFEYIDKHFSLEHSVDKMIGEYTKMTG